MCIVVAYKDIALMVHVSFCSLYFRQSLSSIVIHFHFYVNAFVAFEFSFHLLCFQMFFFISLSHFSTTNDNFFQSLLICEQFCIAVLPTDFVCADAYSCVLEHINIFICIYIYVDTCRYIHEYIHLCVPFTC